MQTRNVSERNLERELLINTHMLLRHPRPLSMRAKADDLLRLLQEKKKPAQEIADLWVAELQKWSRQKMWIGDFAIPLPRRRPRPIHIIDE